MDLPEISRSLAAAKAGLEAATARRAAIAATVGELGDAVTASAVRRAELEGEIARRRGAILKAKALAKIPAADGKERMGAREIAGAERELAALCAENDELRERAEEADAGRLALADEIASARADVIDAAQSLVREVQQCDQGLATAFARDLGRLTLPALFRKWGAVGHPGVVTCLKGFGVSNFGGSLWDGVSVEGAPILQGGRYLDPDSEAFADWGAAWQSDQALVARHAEFADIRRAAQHARGDDRPRQGSEGPAGRTREAGRTEASPIRVSPRARQHHKIRAGDDAARAGAAHPAAAGGDGPGHRPKSRQ